MTAYNGTSFRYVCRARSFEYVEIHSLACAATVAKIRTFLRRQNIFIKRLFYKMKPIFLSIEGINSFVKAQEIDFAEAADANIFCICGPTGSGKTTILDSVILALYGKGDRGVKDDYINLSCDKGTIIFRFELGGTEWEVKRVFSRKAGGDKAYLTNVSENGDMIADGVEKVNAEMQKLVGLSRGDFTQVVILEQGKFGKFLTADKTERNKTIAQLFSLDKFDGLSSRFNAVADKFKNLGDQTAAKAEHLKDLSKELLKSKKAELKIAENQLGETEKALKKLEAAVSEIALNKKKYEDATAAKEALDKAQSEFNALKAAEKELEARREKLAGLEKSAEKAKENRDKAMDILSKSETVRQAKARINELETVRAELRKDYAEQDKLRKETADKIAEEKAEREKIFVALKELFPETEEFDAAALSAKFNTRKSELNAAVAADGINIDNLKKERERLISLREKFADADGKIPALKEKFERAEKAEKDAEKTFESARTANAALSVANALKDGDACPVCGGVYHSGACAGGAGDTEISALKGAFDAAKAERERSASDLKSICETRDRLFKDIIDAEKSAAEALKKIRCTQNESEIATAFLRLNEEFSSVCKAVELTGKAAVKDGGIEKLSRAEAEIKSAIEIILQKGKSCSDEIEKRKGELKALVGDDFENAEKAAKETLENCDKAIKEFEDLRSELNKDAQEHGVRVARITADISHYEKAAKAAGDAAFDEKAAKETETARADADARKTALISTITALKTEIDTCEKGLIEKAALDEEIKYFGKRYDTAKTLSNLFRGNKFLEYVEEEYIREFTDRASEKLFELSGGKFTLDYVEDEKKSDFWVSDHLRGGEKRKVRTLSGGETFLASLSMAIAISEQIAHNRSYDFFFLDEGFGTLDENAIDVVAAALYKLAGETMVGLVSHRSELVEKIPSRIKVIPATEDAGSGIILEKA